MSLYQQILKHIKSNYLQIRLASSIEVKNDEISPVFTNRNPRNLEKMRIGYKPDGYYVDKPGRNFWHKLELKRTDRHIIASIIHYRNGEVLQASTKEWSIKKHLYKTTDVTAYINVARVLAQRCLESGLVEFMCDLKPTKEDGKIDNFLKTLKENGLTLSEPEQYKTIYPWTRARPEKPWEVTE